MKFLWKGKEWYIDGYLATQLNSIIFNIKKDWDFVILVTGDRSVRIGKSILSMTIAAYLAYAGNKMQLIMDYALKDVYFDSKLMMSEAQSKPLYSINHYDEGRQSLAASKSMKQFQQDLIDFFNECGQLNQIFIVTLPDFFELKENIAVGRSEFLINVYRKEATIERDIFNDGVKMPIVRLDRGFFEFFSRRKKQLLYDIAKSTRRKSYGLVKADFIGRFTNQYTIDEEKYKAKKRESLARFAERHQKETQEEKDVKLRNNMIIREHEFGKSGPEIIKVLAKYDIELGIRQINTIIQEYKDFLKENEFKASTAANYTTILEGVKE